MDWALHTHRADRRGREPQLEQLQVYWRLVGPSARQVTCALYRTDAGLEVRAERSADDLIYSQRVQTQIGGEGQATVWRQALLDLGGFTELDASGLNSGHNPHH